MSLSIACQDEPQGLFHRSCILFRQRPELADQESVIEGKELEANLARNTESGLPPAPDCHVTLPIATRRGDHRQDRLLMNPIEVFRRDGKPAFLTTRRSKHTIKGRDSCLVFRENHVRGPGSLQKKCLTASEPERPCFVTRGVKEAICQVRLRAPSGSRLFPPPGLRLVLTALSRTSPRHVVRNAG